jgi:hypothetical protein
MVGSGASAAYINGSNLSAKGDLDGEQYRSSLHRLRVHRSTNWISAKVMERAVPFVDPGV